MHPGRGWMPGHGASRPGGVAESGSSAGGTAWTGTACEPPGRAGNWLEQTDLGRFLKASPAPLRHGRVRSVAPLRKGPERARVAAGEQPARI